MEEKKTKKADLENKKGLFFQIGLVFILAIVLWAFNYKSYDKKEFVELTKDTQEVIEDIVIQTAADEPPPPQEQPQEQSLSEELVVTDDIKKGEEYTGPKGDAQNVTDLPPPPAPVQNTETEEKEEEIFVFAEQQPEFNGGEEALLKYLAENIKYPDYAKQNNIQGRVYISFVVEKDGSITNVTVKRDIGGGCGAEAVRVVKAMPRWKPGKQRDKSVRVAFTLPVNFKLR